MEPDRGRSRRIVAGAVGIAFFVGAVWLIATGGAYRSTPEPPRTPTPNEPAAVATPSPPPRAHDVSARVGFVGLPPEGARPSEPRRGELVLGYQGRRFATWYEVWVYEDGRVIWQREGNLPEGANEIATGFLEQRLTRAGLRMLLARGDAETALFGFPWRPPYPASWLPARAWEERTIRAFVPSRFAVCYQALWRPVPPARLLRWLPEAASELLRATIAEVRSARGWLRGFDGACSVLPTERAREVAASLRAAGLRQDAFQRAYGLTYHFRIRRVRDEAVVRFEPVLPHGVVACSGCG